MKQWHDIMHKVLTTGVCRPDRTGVGTFALFGEQLRFNNIADNFPAVTTKKLAFGQVAAELACFLNGYDNLADFHKMGCNIWDGNGESDYWKPRMRLEGDLGRIYGVQWRDWLSVNTDSPSGFTSLDQLKVLVNGLLTDPYGRRHLVTAWNPGELDKMCLPPCHVLFQCFVRRTISCPLRAYKPYTLDLRVDMRSVDLFLGLPFDVASYALLQQLIANEVNMRAGDLIFQLGDAHIYLNHQEQVRSVLAKEPKKAPILVLRDDSGLFRFDNKTPFLVDYEHHGAVPAPLNI